MMQQLFEEAAPFITPLEMNGLKGRMLYIPAKNKKYADREILFIYGIHGSLERFLGVAKYLSRFGNVTMPDLPGLGGMQSFRKAKIEENFSSYADYIATFIKLRYRGKKISLISLSFSFPAVTLMLQKYPALRSKINTLSSVVGITDKKDFNFTKLTRCTFESLFFISNFWPTSLVMRYIILQKPIFMLSYRSSHPKMKDVPDETRKELIKFETHLWHVNDIRTYGNMMHKLINVKLPEKQIPMTVHHVGTDHDQWLVGENVEEGHRSLYQSAIFHKAVLKNHGPTLWGDEAEAEMLFSESIRKVLRSDK